MSFASTLRQSQFSLLQYLFQDLNQALCFCLRHIITSPFKFTIQRYFCPYFQYPPPRNFAKIHARGGRGLLPVQPKDSIPPWGHSGTRRRGAAAVPEPGGRGGTAAVCLAGLDAGGLLPGRREAAAVPGRAAGVFGAGNRGLFARRRAANGARAGLGRVGPTKAACRARRRGAGTFPGSGARAVYGGFPGRTRGRRGPGGAIRRAGRV